MDLNADAGKASKDDFDKQYDPQRTIFIPCDVSNEEKFKG